MSREPFRDWSPEDQDRLAEFLRALHPSDAEGVVEIRFVPPKGSGRDPERVWLESGAAVVEQLDEVRRRSDELEAAVYIGVLGRRARGCGTAADVLPGRAAWADVDAKGYGGDKAAARARIEQFPLKPTALIDSGNGYHPYCLLREPTEPRTIRQLSYGLHRAFDGDPVHDVARVLRLPGTLNRKDPSKPKAVRVEEFHSDLLYNPGELVEAFEALGIDLSGAASTERKQGTTPPDDEIADTLPEHVRALLAQRKGIRDLFEGHGKSTVTTDGGQPDRSPSGYDMSLLVALIRAGVKERADLAASIWNRPASSARDKGQAHVWKTVDKALAWSKKASPKRSDHGGGAIAVEHVAIIASDPALYVLTIQGTEITFNSAQLRSPAKFATRYLDALHRIPCLPDRKEWPDFVNAWLERAVKQEMPEEASEEPALREAIREAIADLAAKDDPAAMDHGNAYRDGKGVLWFKAAPIKKSIHGDWPHLERHSFYNALRQVAVNGQLPGGQTRAWRLS